MKIDEITQASLLYDFYGQLLSKRQSEVMELYHEALKNAERALSEYEAKLGLVAKFRRSSDAVRQIDSMIDSTIELLERGGAGSAEKAAEDLKKVKHIIDELEE